MPQGNRRAGTAHHHRRNQRHHHHPYRQTRKWGLSLLAVMAMSMPWPQVALGQSPAPTQPLDSGSPDDASWEWGDPLPTDPEISDSETPTPEAPNSDIDPTSPPVNEASDPVYLRPSEACPAEYETLVTTLLRDLPQYANLVAARSFRPPVLPPTTDTAPAAPPPTDRKSVG